MLLNDGALRLRVVELPEEDESQRVFQESLTEIMIRQGIGVLAALYLADDLAELADE